MKNVWVYDNGGTTFDRYTAVYLDRPAHYAGGYEARGMSSDPYHPQGLGMYMDAVPGRHLGRRIAFDRLPEACRRLVASDRAEIK